MAFRLRALLLPALLLFSLAAFSKDFSSWRQFTQGELISETTGFAPGSVGTVGLHIHLQKKWHTYWVNPGDSGASIRLHFLPSKGVQVKEVEIPIPDRVISGPLVSFAYSDELLLPIQLQIDSALKPGTVANLSLEAEWLVCDEVCIPAIDKLQMDLPIVDLSQIGPGPSFKLFQEFRARVPQMQTELPQREDRDGQVALKFANVKGSFVDFFPFKNTGLANATPQVATGETLQVNLPLDQVSHKAVDRAGVLVLRDPTTGRVEARQYGDSGWEFSSTVAARDQEHGLLWMWLSAFLGGLVLNLMPCVFPILSFKLLSLLKISDSERAEIRWQNLSYSVGVVASFLAIATVLLLLRRAGNLVGWGFQLQSPIFVMLLAWLFFALALNMLGLYEIDILLGQIGHRWTRLGGRWGSFLTGVLAVVVSSPCTAPFMGVAIGFGLSQPIYVMYSVFFCLGFGLAFPYLLFVFAPGLAHWLPRPGIWMLRLKQFLSVPLLLTVFWLLWLFWQIRGSAGLGAFILGLVAIAVSLTVRQGRRVLLFVAMVMLVVCVGFVYQSVAPEPVEALVSGDWQPFRPKWLASHRGQNAFVNLTADWCLSCKVNERLVFNDPEVLQLLKGLQVQMMKGDWTRKNGDISEFLTSFNRIGVPFYVLYSTIHPDGRVLPEVLTKSSFIEMVKEEFATGGKNL